MSDISPSFRAVCELLKPAFCPDTCYDIAHTWTPSCFDGSFSVFSTVMQESMKIYLPLYLVAAILRREKFEYFTKKFFQDIILSSLAIAVNGSGFVAGACLLRKILGGFYLLTMAFFPGLLASFAAINIERKERQSILALYMFNNAIEVVYNMLKKRGLILIVPYGEVWLLCLTTAVMMYLYRKGDGLNKGMLHNIIKFLIGTKRPEEILKQRPSPWQQEELFKRAMKIMAYDSVKHSLKAFTVGYCLQLLTHIPIIVKKPSLLFNVMLYRVNFQCGMFLGSYVAIFKVVEYLLTCFLSRYDSICSLVAGGLSGLSMMVYRSSTIALYLASKVGEIVYKKGINQGILPNIPYARMIIYTVSTAIVFHAAAFDVEAVRPSYWRYLNQITHRRFCEINRHRLGEVFNLKCAKYFPSEDLYKSLRR